jgi:hypothetical protein
MTHLLVVNVIFFIIPTCGACTFGLFVYRFLRGGDPPAPPASPPGGTKAPAPAAGPDDLARSA